MEGGNDDSKPACLPVATQFMKELLDEVCSSLGNEPRDGVFPPQEKADKGMLVAQTVPPSQENEELHSDKPEKQLINSEVKVLEIVDTTDRQQAFNPPDAIFQQLHDPANKTNNMLDGFEVETGMGPGQEVSMENLDEDKLGKPTGDVKEKDVLEASEGQVTDSQDSEVQEVDNSSCGIGNVVDECKMESAQQEPDNQADTPTVNKPGGQASGEQEPSVEVTNEEMLEKTARDNEGNVVEPSEGGQLSDAQDGQVQDVNDSVSDINSHPATGEPGNEVATEQVPGINVSDTGSPRGSKENVLEMNDMVHNIQGCIDSEVVNPLCVEHSTPAYEEHNISDCVDTKEVTQSTVDELTGEKVVGQEENQVKAEQVERQAVEYDGRGKPPEELARQESIVERDAPQDKEVGKAQGRLEQTSFLELSVFNVPLVQPGFEHTLPSHKSSAQLTWWWLSK